MRTILLLALGVASSLLGCGSDSSSGSSSSTSAPGGGSAGAAGGAGAGGASAGHGGAAGGAGGGGKCSSADDPPGSGEPCKWAVDCPMKRCTCKDGSAVSSALSACSLMNGQCSSKELCESECCHAGGLASIVDARTYFVDAPECKAFCAKVAPLGCGKQGATDPCDPYETCSAPYDECAAAVKALLTCQAEKGTFSCGASGWEVEADCPKLPVSCL